MFHKILPLFLSALLMSGCASNTDAQDNTSEESIVSDKQIKTSEAISDFYEGDRLLRSIQVYFDTDSSVLPHKYNDTISLIRQALSHDSEIKLYIQGHADKRGDRDYNTKLSRKRAEAIIAALELQEGTYKRVGIDFFGEDEPRCKSDTQESLSCNRRVDIYLVK